MHINRFFITNSPILIIVKICIFGPINNAEIQLPMPNGITYNRSSSGKTTSVTFNLKKYGAQLEDLLDRAEIEKRRHEPTIPLKQVLSRLDKKNGLKTKE